jgi:hypothetical protein
MKIFGPYKRQKDGRQIVIVVEKNNKRRTVSYPKWIMELQIGRKLGPDETVDHIDGNVNNNTLDNLQVIDRSEHSSKDTRRVKNVKFHCAWCDKEFERSPRLVRDKAKKGKAGVFCSRQCAGKYSRQLQLKLIDKFDCQPVIDSEYYTIRDMTRNKTASYIIDVSDVFIDYYCNISDGEDYYVYI